MRTGTPRHLEDFARRDFWVTVAKPLEILGNLTPAYANPPEPLDKQDIVVWYYSGVHHLVRDEDGRFVNGRWDGDALVMWTGFTLKPHNIFDRTPLRP